MFDAGTIKIGIEVDDKGAKQGIDKVKNQLQSSTKGIDKYSAGISKIGKIASKAAIATTGAIVAIGKSALTAYASYEQLTGGVEKLFGDSASIVMKNANKAYKTAGVSANKYMEQATSFSASLITSLGGDTAKAAKYADTAVKDMSDNVNVFGSKMEDVQRAYQGFARGQFGMLDNLKLGYGGTKTEMERLLADAEKLTGKKFDVSNFSDIVEAIHAIQEEMNITGTTSKEAADTIEGSVASMKSAWENWLTAIGSGSEKQIKRTTEAMVDSIKNVVKNALPVIGNVLSSLKGLVAFAGAAFGVKLVSKILLATSALNKYVAAAEGASIVSGVFSGKIKGSDAILGSLGTKIGKVASNFKFLGATGGVAVGALTALTATAALTAYGIKKAYDSTHKYRIEVEEMAEKHQDAIKTINDTSKEAEMYAEKVEELAKVEDKSNSQKALMAEYVERLNELIPNLNLKYDEEEDKLNKTADAIYKVIDAYREEAKVSAYKNNASASWKKEAELAIEKEEALKRVNQAQKAYNDAVKSGYVSEAVSKELQQAKVALNDTTIAYRNASIEATKWDNQMVKSSGQWKTLTDEAKKAGVEIPQSLKDGISEGTYAIPQTVEGIKNLIKFDSLASKARGAGKDVTDALAQGMRDGEIKPSEAVKISKDWSKLDTQFGKAGKKAAEKYAEQLNNGEISVDQFKNKVAKKLEDLTSKSGKKNKVKVDVEADTKKANKQINSVTKNAGKKKVKIKVTADTKQATSDVNKVNNKKIKDKKFKVNANNVSNVLSSLTKINNKKLNNKSFTVTEYHKTVNTGGGKSGKKHRIGLREVPYDNYIAELHKGEAVLTAAEVNQYKQLLNNQKVSASALDKIGEIKAQSETTNYSFGDITLEVSKLQDVTTLEDIVKIFKQAKAFA